MSTDTGNIPELFRDETGRDFLIRWRGQQEGPYTAADLESKLTAHHIGLLHEVLHHGQWITLRDYFAQRDASLRAQHEAREQQERRAREEAEREAGERKEQIRAELLAEERRRNDLLAESLVERQSTASSRHAPARTKKPHRAGTILAFALIGLFLFGPLCIAAWVMGDSDLREMDAGLMDESGRSTTSSGRSLGILGTALWIIGAMILLF